MAHRANSPAGRFRPTRRQFLVGGAATALLVACGNDDDGDSDDDTEVDAGLDLGAPSDYSVVRFFGPYYAAGAVARVPFGLADREGPMSHDLSPAAVDVSVRDDAGNILLDGVRAPLHHEGLPRAYYAFEVTPDAPGIYDIVLDVDGAEVLSQFQVVDPEDGSVASRVDPGDRFPRVQTPTAADTLDVTPICTEDPQCGLHEHSIDTVLGAQPTALLISTPAFCQIGVCGPVLDLLIDSVADHPDVAFIHAEVYRNPAELSGAPTPEDLAPIMGQTGLAYEPALYTIDAEGTVVNRLDYIFGAEEIRAALSALA